MGIAVLIVDDSDLIRRVLKKVIRQTGIEIAACLEAGDGAEALRLLTRQPVDLILTDINMPGMDGIEMLTQLKRTENCREIPVIVISTEGSADRVDEAMELGAVGYIMKPFTPEALAERLRSLGLIPPPEKRVEVPVDSNDPRAF